MQGSLSVEDRILGCLLGGAMGDAVGAHFEGTTPTDSFCIPDDLRVTDDTQLTIATCEAIIEHGTVDPEAIAARFLDWFRRRKISGIGSSTLKALTELSVGGHWAYVGAVGEYSAGNGAAMRIAPVAFVLDPEDYLQRRTIRDICQIIHRNDEAYIGALALVRSIRYVVDGNSLGRELLSHLVSTLPDSRVRDRFIVVEQDSMTLMDYASKFQSGGYVVDSVPLAILAAIESTDYLSTISAIVKIGGDTDTIGSMCCQMLGAANGLQFFPPEQPGRVDEVTLVRKTAVRFARIAQGCES